MDCLSEGASRGALWKHSTCGRKQGGLSVDLPFMDINGYKFAIYGFAIYGYYGYKWICHLYLGEVTWRTGFFSMECCSEKGWKNVKWAFTPWLHCTVLCLLAFEGTLINGNSENLGLKSKRVLNLHKNWNFQGSPLNCRCPCDSGSLPSVGTHTFKERARIQKKLYSKVKLSRLLFQ